jgi:deoxyribonuclease-4
LLFDKKFTKNLTHLSEKNVKFLQTIQTLPEEVGGFVNDTNRAEFFDLVEKSLNVIEERLSRLDIEIELRPELTGKTSQFGSLEELISLSKSVTSCKPCMDFSHLYARTGSVNDYKGFCDTLETLKNELGPKALEEMHIHISGISSNSKGDLKHLNLEKSKFNWKDLMKALKDMDCRGYVVCNSPNLEVDAQMLKQYYVAL